MKRVRCPKCDNYTTFDETRYAEGQQLVFQCPSCNKQFAIRLNAASLHPHRRTVAMSTSLYENNETATDSQTEDFGSIIVIENVFHYKQVIPLALGENVIGRYVKENTAVNRPIETVDPSVDTKHCIITVQRDKRGDLQYLLRDAPSETGTFVENTILRTGQRYPLDDGSVVTIGATTFILRAAGQSDDE